jgi:peptidoglycan hydrolase-like protein with peptidoglycan-binding domain
VRSRSRRGQATNVDRGPGRLAAAISRHPREFVGVLMATLAIFAICINALFLQRGPHPAPIFATHPLSVQDVSVALPRPRAATPAVVPAPAARSQVQVIGDIQRELSRKGFYDGVADGIWGAKTDAAARDFVQAAGLKITAEPSESLLHAMVISNFKAQSGRAATPAPVRNDPIAELIAPTKQLLAIQRALADFGYGQIKPSGVYDRETQAAIEKFERDRRLPVTGQISDQLVRELAAMTGRPLE